MEMNNFNIPCENCITKVMCRNELYYECLRQKKMYNDIYFALALKNILCCKCSIINDIFLKFKKSNKGKIDVLRQIINIFELNLQTSYFVERELDE